MYYFFSRHTAGRHRSCDSSQNCQRSPAFSTPTHPRRLLRAFSFPIVLALLTLWVALTPSAAAAAASSSGDAEPVYLLNAMYTENFYRGKDAEAIWEGIDAAFYAVDYTVGGNRPLRIVDADSSVNMSDIVAVIEKAFADYPTMLGLIGPFSDNALITVLQSSVVINNNLTCLGPFTGSSTVREWNPNVYFTRAEPLLELKVVLHYVLNTLRATRIAYMYLSGARYGYSEYASLKTMLSSLARKPASLYVSPYSETDINVDTTAFDTMANTNPQVIIIWGIPGDQTFEFARQVMMDSRTSSSVIIGCYGLQQVIYDAYLNASTTASFTMTERQIFTSATSRVPSDANTDTTHMTIFTKEMGNYLANSGKSAYSLDDSVDLATFFEKYSIASQLMVVGWLTGKVILRTLNIVNWIADRTAYKSGIFDQNRFIIGGDAVFGDYGGTCNVWAADTGAMCSCNQGGHSAILVSLASSGVWSMMPDSHFFYTQSDCYSTDVSLPTPLSVVAMYLADDTELSGAATRLSTIIPSAFSYFNISSIAVNMAELQATSATQQSVLDREVANYTVDVLTGPLAADLLVDDLMVAAPAFARPHPTIQKKNYVIMMPTLEQEIYLLYAHLATVASVTGVAATVHAVLHGYNSSEAATLTTLIETSAETFGYAFPVIRTVALDDDVTSHLATSGVNLLIGLTNKDHSAVPAFLAAHTGATIVVDYKDFALAYTSLLSYFDTLEASVQRRFLTFTNMPLWTDTSDEAHAASTMLSIFHELVKDTANHTPAMLEDLVCAAFLQELASNMDVINSSALIDSLYLRGVISAYGMNFGLFQWTCSTTATGDTCTYQNYGAQSIVVLSMERVLNPSVDVTVAASTPSMIYTALPDASTGISGKKLAGIIVGSVVGGLILIAVVLLVLFCCILDTRNNDAAPRDVNEPVTMIFTDIESSTALWAALPQLMPDAVAAHHRVIRAVITKYACYEVKTIGDSFMIACKDAGAAVKVATEIQTRLLDCDWKTEIIDECYRHFEMQRSLSTPDDQPPTALLAPNVYNSLWHGFRVRMGIHTGLSDIRLDEVTKGYDYYGDTSNMAARTEAIANGGQVIMTEATWWALSDATRASLSFLKMGPQGLRGVPHAVDMYQLNAVPGRQFAGLRTEIEAALPDISTSQSMSNGIDDHLSSHTNLTPTSSAVAFVLASCFSTYPPAQRVRELQPLLSKWSVPAPPRAQTVSEEDYCQGLLNRLAVKVGRVTEARMRLNGAETGLELNPFASFTDFAAQFQNPLRPNSSFTNREMEDAPPQMRNRSTVMELREFFRSIVSPHSSVREPSRRVSKRSSATNGTDTVTVFDISASRETSGGPHLALGEPIGLATLLPTRLTKRVHRLNSRSEGGGGDGPLGNSGNSASQSKQSKK